jgi:hypothetical protein
VKPLSRWQRQALDLLVAGHSQAEAARLVGKSERSVRRLLARPDVSPTADATDDPELAQVNATWGGGWTRRTDTTAAPTPTDSPRDKVLPPDAGAVLIFERDELGRVISITSVETFGAFRREQDVPVPPGLREPTR